MRQHREARERKLLLTAAWIAETTKADLDDALEDAALMLDGEEVTE